MLVRQEGFEPPTPALEGRCSIQLSYWRILIMLFQEWYFWERVKGNATLCHLTFRYRSLIRATNNKQLLFVLRTHPLRVRFPSRIELFGAGEGNRTLVTSLEG